MEYGYVLDSQGDRCGGADAGRCVECHAPSLQLPEFVARFAAAELAIFYSEHFTGAVIDNYAGGAMHAVLVQDVVGVLDAINAVGLIQ